MGETGQIVAFNRHCADATVGYMKAATMAYAAMFEQAMQFWSTALGVTPEKPADEPKSWYRPPADADLALSTRKPTGTGGAGACMMPWAIAGAGPANMPGSPEALFAYASEAMPMMAVAPWMMLANPRYMQAFPMAAGMIAVGVPRSVAWPTAEANAAAMDAINMLSSAARSASAGSSVTRFRAQGFATPAMLQMPQQISQMSGAPLGLAVLMNFLPDPLLGFLSELFRTPEFGLAT